MHETAVKTVELAGNVANQKISLFSLIIDADITVKLVILVLLAASIISWSIIFNKLLKFSAVSIENNKFEKSFWSGQLLEQLYERIKGRANFPLANIFVATMHEWNRYNLRQLHALDEKTLKNIKQRLSDSMDLIKNREMDKLESNIHILAIISSSTTFIGLFGTVWGIMHSFQSIAASKNTSLAVVAPGIAEALLATAIGLIAAIPASIFYNILSNKLNSFQNKMEDFSAELGILLSRELDEVQR